MLDNEKATLLLSMALGNNAPPKVLSKKDFESYLKSNPNAPEIFRGVTDIVDEKSKKKTFPAKTASDDLKYDDATWIGGNACIYGAGIYFSDKVDRARMYSGHGAGVISRGCIDMSKAKVATYEDLYNKVISSYAYKNNLDFKDAISAYALAQGYNVIKKRYSSSENYYVVLDRSVLVMQKEDL